jgi:hypothetical protein
MTRGTVWLASYPKSGNTWFRSVFVAWRQGGPVDLNLLRAPGTAAIASSRARVEDALGIPSSLFTADEIDLMRPRVDEVASEDSASSDDGLQNCLCKIHDALFCGPAGEPIVSVATTRAAIYIVRDPRDVAVSVAHHNSWSHERAVAELGDPEAALSRAVHSQVRQRLGSWSEHVGSWLDQELFPVHVVRYEDCHHDPVATFTAALGFAGFEANKGDIAVAVDAVSFDRLQAQEAATGFRERPALVDRFFRRGVVGSWRDELTHELVERVETDHGDVMRRLGYLGEAAPEGRSS